MPDGPSRLQVLQQCHDTPMAGHFGIHKNFALISRRYWWPRLRHFVTNYVRSCDKCCRSKKPRHHPYGLLQPMPIPKSPWKSFSLDFITDLPPSSGFDAILMVVDCFTNMTHFFPCTKVINSQETTDTIKCSLSLEAETFRTTINVYLATRSEQLNHTYDE